MSVKISADSTCDLSKEMIDKYGVDITPLYIVMDDRTLRDGIDCINTDIFEHVSKTGELCSTAAVSVADYMDFFSEQLKKYDEVVHFTISADMSSCYQNACIAAEELGNVYVVDSQSLSTGIGLLVLDASDMAKSGMSGKDIKAALDEKKLRLDVSFVLDTLTYIYKGGRCSAVAAFGANILKLKPCIEVKDGKMGVGKKYRGSIEKCLETYVEDRLKGADNVDYSRIFITSTVDTPEIVEKVKQTIMACGSFEDIVVTCAGGTISNHCGPNCLGILFYRKA